LKAQEEAAAVVKDDTTDPIVDKLNADDLYADDFE